MSNLVQITELQIDPALSITQLFEQYQHLPWAMLLDSATDNSVDGRFDIMVADPIATVTTRGNNSVIRHIVDSKTTQSQANPIDVLSKLTTDILGSAKHNDTHLPFTVGAIGYFAYDLGRRFERFPCIAKTDTQSPDMAVGIYAWSIIKDNQQDKFYLCHIPKLTAPRISTLINNMTKKAGSCNFTLSSAWQANMTASEYGDKIAKIHAYLEAGDCYQVNLAQRFTADYKGNPWSAYKALRTANRAPFSAFVKLEDCTIASVSPERFLSVQDNKVQSKPIKGTRPRRSDIDADKKSAESLANSEKDRAENLMIVDLLRNDISKHCIAGSVKVPELFSINSFAAVHHMVSTVEGQLANDSNSLNLLQGAFPGGSITGAPKIRAMEVIEELEPHRRNIYCGSIGYIDVKGNMDTSICIRTLLFEQGKVHCWAGGGIVNDSNSEDEYQESLDKVAKILPVLELINE